MSVAGDDLPEHADRSGCLARQRLRHDVGLDHGSAVGERRAQNVPGTDTEYPNWQIPLADGAGRAVLLDDLASDPRFTHLTAAVDAAF